jgi:hypothetical protein
MIHELNESDGVNRERHSKNLVSIAILSITVMIPMEEA